MNKATTVTTLRNFILRTQGRENAKKNYALSGNHGFKNFG
jgi:hypothetical protein